MISSDYPVLYTSASVLSGRAQKRFFMFLGTNLLLLVTSISSTELVSDASISSLVLLLQLLVSISCAIALAFWKDQQVWYESRALAESIKTMAWRYMMRSDPYHTKGDDKPLFIANLTKLLEDNRSLKFEALTGEQITNKMSQVRASDWLHKMQFYLKDRIEDQLQWYKVKSENNSKKSKWWYLFVIFLHIIAICFLVFLIQGSLKQLWVVTIVLATASASMAWLQTKRFQELASSYALTMHDIQMLKALASTITNEQDFSKFVGDSENAFSREHTQWRARRDVR